MEYRSQETTIRVLRLAVAMALSVAAWGQPLQFEVRHERTLKDRLGRVTFDEHGVQYTQIPTGKQQAKTIKGKVLKLESELWEYQDIQQLWVSPEKLVILTYKDRKWLLGMDQQFEFHLAGEGQSFEPVYEFLKKKLDQRFISALADTSIDAVWEIPAKLLGTLQGSEGILLVSADRVVYKTRKKDSSRTWRLEDIENVSTSGPFQLTLTTYERAKTHYGSMKGFNFQLKQRLDEKRLDFLWERLHHDKGLEVLTLLRKRSQTVK